MEDYEINPELVVACETEIRDECKGMEQGGRTLHCLMDAARQAGRTEQKHMSEQCMRAVGLITSTFTSWLRMDKS